MVIHDLNITGTVIRPTEAHAPLVVDPDAVLPLAITLQRLKAMAWRGTQVGELCRGVQHIEFSFGDRLERSPPGRACAVAKKPFGSRIRKTPDHDRYYMVRITYQSTP